MEIYSQCGRFGIKLKSVIAVTDIDDPVRYDVAQVLHTGFFVFSAVKLCRVGGQILSDAGSIC